MLIIRVVNNILNYIFSLLYIHGTICGNVRRFILSERIFPSAMVEDDIATLAEDSDWVEYDEGDLWEDSYGTLYTNSEDWLAGENGYEEASDGIYYSTE